MASSIETWFTALTHQNKQLFLVTLGANLTAFARQATRLGELRGMNEIQHHIYQAIKTMSVGQLTFSADEFWEALNSVAKDCRLDMALHRELEMSKMLIEDKAAQYADYKQNSMNVALTRTPEKTSTQADSQRLAFIAELSTALNDSAVKGNVTSEERAASRGWRKRRSHLARYWGNVGYSFHRNLQTSHLTQYWGDVAYSFRSDLRIFYLDCRRFLGT
jgi:hypothetical protein